MQVTLRVPVADADWDKLTEFPDNIDEPDEREGYVVVEIETDSVDQVVTNARKLYRKRRITVEGNSVTVERDLAQWLKPLNLDSSPYDRALKAACQRVNDRPEFREWWSRSGSRQLLFHQIREDGKPSSEEWEGDLLLYVPVDGSVMDDEKGSDRLEEVVEANVRRVLDVAAETIGERPAV